MAEPVAGAVRIIVAGGTIDKAYDPIAGALALDQPAVPAMLSDARASAPIEVEIAFLIDSRDMSESDRAELLSRCARAPEPRIVLTHGTDTMEQTARLLGAAALDKTIVLTGAMVPYRLGGSDAMFNLGFALASAQRLPAGVWIAMNGVAWPWHDVRKDRKLGRFGPAASPHRPGPV